MEWVQHVRQTIISAVAQYADLKKVLWLVSSDFTHYGPRFNYQPYGNLSANPDQIFKKIADQDISIAHSLCELDISAAIQTWQMTRPTICGFIPSLVVSAIMQQLWNGRIQGRVNSYYTSASVMRSSPQVLEDSNAVAYASLAFRLT
jgi:AmmeMemoRadiSam system protein B